MSSADEAAAEVAGLLRSISDELAMVGQFRQGTVDAYHAGPPRTVDVELSDGIIPDVPLLVHHTAPSAGQMVWIVQVRPGGWLYLGRQG